MQSNPVELPTGRWFYRRWQVDSVKGHTAVELSFSFVPGFSEYSIHVRGSLAAATVDFERNTYTLHRHTPQDQDFDSYAMVAEPGEEPQTAGAPHLVELRGLEAASLPAR